MPGYNPQQAEPPEAPRLSLTAFYPKVSLISSMEELMSETNRTGASVFVFLRGILPYLFLSATCGIAHANEETLESVVTDWGSRQQSVTAADIATKVTIT